MLGWSNKNQQKLNCDDVVNSQNGKLENYNYKNQIRKLETASIKTKETFS